MTDHLRDDAIAMLRVLVDAERPLSRHETELRSFGRSPYMAWRAITALKWLVREGYAEDAYNPMTGQFHGRYSATSKGRVNSHLLSALDAPSGGAA